jgi:ubiquinone/menaquinone biosynthesis C-methylase UbiE
MTDQQELSAKQFGAKAANYLSSSVHSTGADLERLTAVAGQLTPGWALDVGCGAGHASFALARGGARRVTAYDPSSEMLAVVAREAAARGYCTLETFVGTAEALPFATGTFDLVVTRYSAHHWASVPRALAECARVMSPGGRLIVIDVIAPETPLLDTSLQVVEFLRDASHVRNYRISEWNAMQKAAGFGETTVSRWKIELDFESWIARIGTPPARVAALQAVFGGLPSEVREYFQVAADLSFSIDSAWMEAPRAG